MAEWADDILLYWFEHLEPKDWFAPTPDIDQEITNRFHELWESHRHETAVTFLASPEIALAAVILFDQFPRNMFRGKADSYASDGQALKLAGLAIGAGMDRDMTDSQKHFLYIPFMHSEKLSDQDRSVALFGTLKDKTALQFAREHRDVIARFGRFPHRNAALGRQSSAEEEEAIAKGQAW